jgi:hypothetical protein
MRSIFIIFTFFGFTAFGQNYSVDYSTETYQALSGANLVDETPTGGNVGNVTYELIPIGFDFEFEGDTYNSLKPSDNGWVQFFEGSEDRYISIYDCDLKNFNDTQAESPIYYKTEGTPGNRTFKLEYVKAGFENDSENNDFVHFQLWILEYCNEFEIHVGNHSIEASENDLFFNGNSSAFHGYGSYSPSFDFYTLAGPVSSPLLQSDGLTTLDTIPESGTVFKFSNCQLGINTIVSESDLTIYPNPAESLITIEISTTYEIDQIQLIDLNGRIIQEINWQGAKLQTLNIEELSTGLYFIRTLSTTEIRSYKFEKK